MKIAICDDEELWQKQLKEQLESYYNCLDILIQSFSSGEELLQECLDRNN